MQIHQTIVLLSLCIVACSPAFSAATQELEGGGAGGVLATAGAGGGSSGTAGFSGASDDGECDLTGLRVQMQPTSATQYVMSVIAAPTADDAFEEACNQADNIAVSPVYACCVETSEIPAGTQICVDILMGSSSDPGVMFYVCADGSDCGGMAQYQFLINGQIVDPHVVSNESGDRMALCATTP